jgi:hypothetical protein
MSVPDKARRAVRLFAYGGANLSGRACAFLAHRFSSVVAIQKLSTRPGVGAVEREGAALASCDEPSQDEYNGHRSYGSGIIAHPSIPSAALVAMPDSHGSSGVLLEQFCLGDRCRCKKNNAV